MGKTRVRLALCPVGKPRTISPEVPSIQVGKYPLLELLSNHVGVWRTAWGPEGIEVGECQGHNVGIVWNRFLDSMGPG